MIDLEPLFKKPVAILGAGITGQGVSALLEHLKVPFDFYDANPWEGFRYNCFKEFKPENHNLVVTSPAFGPDHPWVLQAQESGCNILQEIDLAACLFKGKIIAVTGTNGKSTLTTFLASFYQQLRQKAFYCGNVGVPISEAITDHIDNPNAIAVCEVSSYQAISLKHLRPYAVCFTSFAEDHIDRHGSMESYFKAKWNLVELANKANAPVFLHPYIMDYALKLGCTAPHVSRKSLYKEDQRLLPFDLNMLIANSLRDYFTLDGRIFEHTKKYFVPLRHRFEHANTINGTDFYNDSKATNFESALAALKALNQRPIWIAGGKSKGCKIDEFLDQAAPLSAYACLVGEIAKELAQGLESRGVDYQICDTLDDAVKLAYQKSQEDSKAPVLLSPGFSSLDQFASYEIRGETFVRAVSSLEK